MQQDRCTGYLGNLPILFMMDGMVLTISSFSNIPGNVLMHLQDSLPDGTLQGLGIGVGGMVFVIAGLTVIRNWRVQWVPTTGRLTRCSADVVPAGLLGLRKTARLYYAYSYEVAGEAYTGFQSMVETREVFFDPRKHIRECMSHGKIEVLYDRALPGRSLLFRPTIRRPVLTLAAGLGLLLVSAATLMVSPAPHAEADMAGSPKPSVSLTPGIYAARPASSSTGETTDNGVEKLLLTKRHLKPAGLSK